MKSGSKMAIELSLRAFIEHAKTTVALIPEAAAQISLVSEPRWHFGSASGEINRLGPVTMTWRLQFTKVTSQTILLIFRTAEERNLVLDATVTIRVRPLGLSETLPVKFAVNYCTAAWPKCLPIDLSDLEMRRLGPPNAGRENTFFFATGENCADIVAVKDARSKKPALVYSPLGVAGPLEPQSAKYSLAPVLAVLKELTALADQETKWGAPVAIAWMGTASSAIGTILDAIITAASESAESVASASKKLEQPDWLRVGYRTADCEASLRAGITADGSLAERPEEEQFKSSFAVFVDGNSVRLRLAPADFALTGDRKESFFRGFSVPRVRNAFANMLRIASGFVADFLDSAKDTSDVVRTHRDGDMEEYLIALDGSVGSNNIRLVLSGKFRVTDDSFDADADSFEGVLFKQPTDVIRADHQVMSYFFQLIQNVTTWGRILSK